MNNINNISYMCFECNSLISFPDKYQHKCPDVGDLSDINSELNSLLYSYDEKNGFNLYNGLDKSHLNLSLSSIKKKNIFDNKNIHRNLIIKENLLSSLFNNKTINNMILCFVDVSR